MTTETQWWMPCRCGATLTEETYDLHMHANHRTPERMREDQDRAAEARHGGREYTRRLSAMTPMVDRLPRLLAGEADADLDRYAREAARALAIGEMRLRGSYWHGASVDHPARTWEVNAVEYTYRAPTLPESAFDWPVYRAATGDAEAMQNVLDALVETEGATIEDARRIDECIAIVRRVPGVAY